MSANFDILIVGGGPAGISAALTAVNRGKTVGVIANPPETSKLYLAESITNYPGMEGSGAEIMQKMRSQLENSSAAIIPGKALSVISLGKTVGVAVGNDFYEACSVIIATGISRRPLCEGETKFLGRGGSYCATCDGMLYRGKPVVVWGLAPDAAHEANFLAGIGCAVTYFDRPKRCVIQGGQAVESITCDGQSAAVDAVFLLRPTMAPTDLFQGLAVENGYVTVDRRMATNLPGLFAAGDCTGGPLQVAKAVGEGLIAGQSAAAFLSAAEQKQA